MTQDERLNTTGALLAALFRTELLSIPIRQWGFFFPCYVALWRLIEQQRPGILGPLDAGYDSEPYFLGKGARWFFEILPERRELLDLVEQIMHDVAQHVSPVAAERGFLLDRELPGLDRSQFARLAALALEEADKAIQNQLIS